MRRNPQRRTREVGSGITHNKGRNQVTLLSSDSESTEQLHLVSSRYHESESNEWAVNWLSPTGKQASLGLNSQSTYTGHSGTFCNQCSTVGSSGLWSHTSWSMMNMVYSHLMYNSVIALHFGSSMQKDASLGHSGTTLICLGLSGKAEVGTWWLETTAH